MSWEHAHNDSPSCHVVWLQWLAGGLLAKGTKLAWSYPALPEASHELGELAQLDITPTTFSEGAEAGLEGGWGSIRIRYSYSLKMFCREGFKATKGIADSEPDNWSHQPSSRLELRSRCD